MADIKHGKFVIVHFVFFNPSFKLADYFRGYQQILFNLERSNLIIMET